MKKIAILLLLAITLFSIRSNAQTSSVSDTLAYLNTIVANKAQYIGQPFSFLSSNLQIQIKYFSPTSGIVYNISKETSTNFAFYFPQTADEMYLTYPHLVIYWQPYLNAKQSDILWENNNGGGWSPSVAGFYANGIIADIKVME